MVVVDWGNVTVAKACFGVTLTVGVFVVNSPTNGRNDTFTM